MQLSAEELARLIDLSSVRADVELAEVDELALQASKHNCIIAYVLPCYLARLKELLVDAPQVGPAAPVGFPSGGHTIESKVAETRELVAAGSVELDMVTNVGMLLSGRYDYVEDEIRRVRDAADGTPLKVILECHFLSNDQIRRGSETCVRAGADWVKTGTGWTPTGATVENIALIKSVVGDDAGVKASGGVRSLDDIAQVYRLGARRFGIGLKTGVKLLEECAALPGGVLEIP